MASSKTCFKCGDHQPIGEFYRHSGMADGHLNKCKACARLDVRTNRLDKVEQYRSYDRERSKQPDRIQNAVCQSRLWRAEDVRRARCHSAVARAIKSGQLKPTPCEWPGCISSDVVAHHENYDHPLVVIWYCAPHHKARHMEMDAVGTQA